MKTPFAEIELFLRIVELGSIRAAAREADVEPSSVSRRLTGLERRLGTQLIDRGQARSRPTPAGQRYYERMRSLLGQVAAVEADVAGEAELPKGLLKVNAPIDFGRRYVAGWLLEFAERHPDVDVELTLASGFVDLKAEAVDLAIRVGRLPDSSLKASKLADVPRVLVASPAYLARRGQPQRPEDLAHHDHVFFAASNRLQPLKLLAPDGTSVSIPRRGRVTINAVHSAVDAVRAGFGIHAGPRWAFQPALDAGEVVELFPAYRQPTLPMNAIWMPAVLLPARIRAFVNFLRERIRQVPGLEPAGLL